MIITRTPFRVSFFGGGTDYPVWYEKHGGAVLSTTINKYCYINCRYLPPFFTYKNRVRYSFREETQKINQIKHAAVRECLNFMRIKHGIEMVHAGDLPARSGIGSSSSFTVGFLNALYALAGKIMSKRGLAADAIHVEHKIIKESIGSQDQVASAFGGFNKITFGGDEGFFVQPITIDPKKLELFQKHFMLFFTGFSRSASEIAKEQIKITPKREKELKLMKEMVDYAVEILNGDVDYLLRFGKLLDETWKIKKGLTKLITTNTIDDIYETGRRAGALGGKLLGAGGGGFILFFVPPKVQPAVKKALKKLLYVPFRFEKLGSQVILYAPQDFF